MTKGKSKKRTDVKRPAKKSIARSESRAKAATASAQPGIVSTDIRKDYKKSLLGRLMKTTPASPRKKG